MFVVTFVAAAPVALICEHLVERHLSTSVARGYFYGDPDGTMVAVMEGRAGTPKGIHPWGEFTITIDEHRRGWPIPSNVHRPAARIKINEFDEVGIRTDDVRSPSVPARAAIDATLAARGVDPELRDALQTGRSNTKRSWFKTVFGTLTWWVLLNFLGTFFGYAAYLVINVFRAKRGVAAEARAARGQCPKCGYDMQGLEFIARCPECGTLVY